MGPNAWQKNQEAMDGLMPPEVMHLACLPWHVCLRACFVVLWSQAGLGVRQALDWAVPVASNSVLHTPFPLRGALQLLLLLSRATRGSPCSPLSHADLACGLLLLLLLQTVAVHMLKQHDVYQMVHHYMQGSLEK